MKTEQLLAIKYYILFMSMCMAFVLSRHLGMQSTSKKRLEIAYEIRYTW